VGTRKEIETMNKTIAHSLGLCCGLPLLLVLVGGGVTGYWSEPAAMACLSVVALAAGYVGWKHFTRLDQEDDWSMDDFPALAELRQPTRED
jgi:hypothetical protein